MRAQAEFSDRTGSGLDEASLVQIGEQPKLRHYDVANRQRRKFTGQLDLFPSDVWSLSVNAGFGNDDYYDSYFGLQDSTSSGPTALAPAPAIDTNATPVSRCRGVRGRTLKPQIPRATGRPIPPRTCTTFRCT